MCIRDSGYVGDPMPFFDPVSKEFRILYLQDDRDGNSTIYHPIHELATTDVANYISFREAIPCGTAVEDDPAIGTGSTVYEESVGQQVMASVSIGPDKRLYCGTIGASNIGSIKAFDINKTLETDSWSIRGGDIQGTNRQK